MKQNLLLATLTISILASCRESVTTDDLIIDLKTPDTLEADGGTTVNFSVDLNNDLDIRNVLFKVDKGSFPDNKDSDSIVVVAEKIDKQLKAIAQFKAPASEGTINVSAEVVIPDRKGEFVKSRSITATRSVVKTIDLTANSFSVYNNFDGEITLTGKLSNSNHKGVSIGNKVKLEDVSSGYQPLNGSFRNTNLSSDASSQVSAIYSPGWINPDQSIFIIMTVLDNSGMKTSIADTLKIAVIHKN